MTRNILIALLFSLFPGALAAPTVGDVPLPHSSAEYAEKSPADIKDAILKLQSLDETSFPADTALCGLDQYYPFSEAQKTIVENALSNIPCRLLDGLKNIKTYDDPEKPRALAGANALHLRSDFFELPEVEAVLIHELGHITDLSGIKSSGYRIESGFYDGNIPIYVDDPSYLFYSISWKDNTGKLFGSQPQDFVTEYAMSDPFEDFAETFLFYLRQGRSFRAYAETNPRIKAKYEFMKTYVFDGTEFNTGIQPANLNKRHWDATRM